MGQVIDGRFEVEGALGEGGAGSVLRARDLTVDRPVALKLLKDPKNPVRVERFRREGAITAGLSHPGIVKIHATGVVEGRPYLVYEMIEGARTLREVARTLSREAALALMVEVADAVGYAHAQKIVHRDLKPDNILLDADDSPRVADFGIALREDLDRLTVTGGFVGTPQYMAPEQLDGRGDAVGPATDVWALGVILYELLCGALPFQGETIQALFQAIVDGRLRHPSAVDPTIPPWLAAVVRRALSVDPAARFPDAAAFAFALRQGEGAGATRLRARAVVLAILPLIALTALGLASRWGSSAPGLEAPAPGAARPTPTSTPTPATVLAALDPVKTLRLALKAGEGPTRVEAWRSVAARGSVGTGPELRRLARQLRERPLRVFAGAKLGKFLSRRQAVLGGPVGVQRVDLERAGELRLWSTPPVHSLELDLAQQRCFIGDHQGQVFVLRLDRDDPPQRVFQVPEAHWRNKGTGTGVPWIRSISLSPDGRWVAATGNLHAVLVLDATTFKVVTTLRTEAVLHAVRWSPQGRYLAYTVHASRKGRVVVHAAKSFKKILERAIVTPTALAFAADDSEVVAGDLTGAMTVFALPSGDSVGLYRGQLGAEVPAAIRRQGFAHQGMVRSIEAGRPGVLLSLCSRSGMRTYERNELRWWSIADRTETRPVWRFPIPVSPRGTTSLSLGPDARLGLVGVGGGTRTPQVEVWAVD